MQNGKKSKLAALGSLCAAVYLASNNLLPGVPDFLLGLLLGVALILLAMGLLPEETLRKIRKWKRHG